MLRESSPKGYTLFEIVAVLMLLAVATSAAIPRIGRAMDGFAARSVRERVAGLLASARARAPGLGGAWVEVREAPPEIRLAATDTVLARLYGAALEGVSVEVGGTRSEAVFRYDALGVGRLASGTLRFRRGEAEVFLVVSAYGRIDRR